MATLLSINSILTQSGFSYGTTLGVTVAGMFPDRMDKVVLDGVVNSHEYYHAYDVEWISGSDVSWSGFFSGCVAAPEACALASSNKTAKQLEDEFYNFMWDLKYNPVPFGESLISYVTIKSLVNVAIYTPSTWPKVSQAFFDLYQGNFTTIVSVLTDLSTGFGATLGTDANVAIKCGDKTVRTRTRAEMSPVVEALYNASNLLGESYVNIAFKCAQWPTQSKEIYQGDFNITTKNPVLFVGGTFDPLTPLVSARNMSSGFVGSGLLEHHGYGVS
jgi:pimeloyl-ACP methyl ester carboxylesterase